MSGKRKILVQLDADVQPALFDRIVALDAGVDELLSYGQVTLDQVQSLVHGCIFTRGPKDLARTAIFIGGSQVAQAEKLLTEAGKHLLPQFGLSVSIMMDANGCNTTAAAAVRCAGRHLDLSKGNALVLGAGPVGQRVAQLLAGLGMSVMLGDVHIERANAACEVIAKQHPQSNATPFPVLTDGSNLHHATNPELIITAGPPGKCLLPASVRASFDELKVMIDVNAVPPLGMEGVDIMDAGINKEGIFSYGALGVGNLKMKIHKAAIAQLFTSNHLVLDTNTIFQLAATV